MSEQYKNFEAQRRQHLMPEVITWTLATEPVVLVGSGQEVEPGMVICMNQYGAQWAMSVEDFDKTYKAR